MTDLNIGHKLMRVNDNQQFEVVDFNNASNTELEIWVKLKVLPNTRAMIPTKTRSV